MDMNSSYIVREVADEELTESDHYTDPEDYQADEVFNSLQIGQDLLSQEERKFYSTNQHQNSFGMRTLKGHQIAKTARIVYNNQRRLL